MLNIFKIYKIVEEFEKLDKKVKRIIVLIGILIILAIPTLILKSKSTEDKVYWDYKAINKSQDLLQMVRNSTIIEDRGMYWSLTNAIDNYISLVKNDSKNKSYKVLTKEYRKYVDKDKYGNISNRFVETFAPSDINNLDYYINKIYGFEENMYLCHLLVDTSSMSDEMLEIYYKSDSEDVEKEIKSEAYIGIKVDNTKNSYEIFYIG